MDRDLRRIALIALLVLSIVGVAAASAHYVSITQNSDGVVLNETGGPSANLTGNVDVYPESGGVSSDTIQWNTTTGNASFTSSGSTSVTLSKNDLSGSWFNGTDLEVSNAELTIDPANQRKISIQGDADELRFQDAALDDGTVDFIVGAPSGSSTVTVRGLPASTTISAINQTSGKAVAVATSDASGTASFSISHSTQTVLLQQGDQSHEPTLSNPDPTTNVSTAPSQLSIDINDGDMPEDSIDAEFFLKKPSDNSASSVGTTSLSSNGTASTSISINEGGVYEWYVEVDDSVGSNSITSSTYDFGVPDELRIYNETDPDQLVKNNVDVTVQFFADDGAVYERSTSDGTIDFSGLPVDESFAVEANPSATTNTAPTYRPRTIYIESLIQQQEIYLLNDNVAASDVVFSLEDNTGQFTPPEETTLFVEKALNKSGTVKYRTIRSDQFSATNDVPTTLETDQRYRLRIKSGDGSQRVLGSYTATGDDAPTLTVGEVNFGSASADDPAFHSAITEENGQRFLQITYYDPANATDQLKLEAVNRSDATDYLRQNTTETGPFGTYTEKIPLSTSKDNVAFNVSYHADRSGFDDQGGTVYVGDVPGIAGAIGLDGEILSAIGFLTIFGVLGLTSIAYPRFAGIPTVVVAIGLTTFGALVIHPLLLAGAGVIALLFAVGGRST